MARFLHLTRENTARAGTGAATMAPMSDALLETERTKLRRKADRGTFDRAVAHAILDEAYLAHVGFVIDGEPRVLPMTFGRDGEVLYLHGAVGNAMLRAAAGVQVCVTVTLLDGLVLARSAFHHSMNYRSVVLLGQAEKVDDLEEKRRAFDVLVEHVLPGRVDESRATNDSELRATLVLRLPIEEGSVKIRVGDAIDDPDDLGLPHWAGVVPLRVVAGAPIANADLTVDAPAPTAERFAR
jgi:nitroimidazol reductase NimA-like FMN-containing flavoprotein (pyridoxamine 5'-phosphate oxidase superfamily)